MTRPARLAMTWLVAALLAAPAAHAIVELDPSFGVTDGNYTALAANFTDVGEFSGAVSGVLISPDWVLTAGHVGVTLTPGSSQFTVGGASYAISSVIVYPTFNGTDLQDDLALVELSTNVGNVTPATLYTGSNEIGLTAAWTGFGETGNGLTGANGTGRGTLRAATNQIDAFYTPSTDDADRAVGTVLLADFDDNTAGNNTLGEAPFPAFWSSSNVTSLEGGLAVGDSGGGVFASTITGAALIGINSFISAGSYGSGTQYSSLIGATRVSSYSGWILSEIPEPGTTTSLAGLFTVLFATIAMGQKRRRVQRTKWDE